MKVYFLAEVAGIARSGEIKQVADGYALNFLLPRRLAIQYSDATKDFIEGRIRLSEANQEQKDKKTSHLFEILDGMVLTFERSVHDDGELYGALSVQDIVKALEEKSIIVKKNQVQWEKPIKALGLYHVPIYLSSRLIPTVKVKITRKK